MLRAEISQRKRDKMKHSLVETYSATGAAAVPRNEGSIVVGAVSSEMAIL
jgi:hypothetical protein